MFSPDDESMALRPSLDKDTNFNFNFPAPFSTTLQLAQKYLKAFKEYNQMREEVLKAKWGQR
jgi:hypothetical protein